MINMDCIYGRLNGKSPEGNIPCRPQEGFLIITSFMTDAFRKRFNKLSNKSSSKKILKRRRLYYQLSAGFHTA
jgi:hypothetical protein